MGSQRVGHNYSDFACKHAQVMLCTDKSGNHWYQHLLASLTLLLNLEDTVNHSNYTSHLLYPCVSLIPQGPSNLAKFSFPLLLTTIY